MASYKTMQGKVVDLDQLRAKHQTTVPVGNLENKTQVHLDLHGQPIEQVDPSTEYNPKKPSSVK